ncbi:hypothetical protein [Acinetobacter dispersus]|uniref:Uncharacterized protein n=1 Tax=Acinetobacter dispersus TaxID=70348 RepID=N9MJ26_9GAMM|nr:hypothetical protein [Acinetobacter dispersus]ENW89944.1 hypothetical protein F904_03693 [Acinetobacter dispersus]
MIIQLMKNRLLLSTCLLLISSSNFAQTLQVPKADTDAIFKAAGFSKSKKGWKSDCSVGEITAYADLNGDGLRDAIVSDYGTMCYGNTGVGYYIVSQQKNGKWKQLFRNSGIPEFLKMTGKNGWPDIENGGPGFCFAVYRWDGQEYKVHRYEYKGKICELN